MLRIFESIMRVVLISDTHCRLHKIKVPDGDLLIHAGDLTFKGDLQEISKELQYLGDLAKNYQKTILVPGNHDRLFETDMSLCKELCENVGVTLLHDSGIQINNLNIYGSAWQPAFCNWAFNLTRGQALKQKWAQIPDNTNVLITHGPPMGILDSVPRYNHQKGEMDIELVGCLDLYNRIQELQDLKLNVFGHIHEGYGQLKQGNITFVNASINTPDYKPINQPIVINL